ncbi:hypothetical protein [Methanoculleus sp.]|uniref:hypothetical protein n=1 Tax=Methanoculleus sp. TaxID=90427 RepID=UPI0017F859FE|nr:hypothetical protein [Methanoculleus sp.]HIH85497.1 hypothetical protein [Methanoculleus sp.]
MRTMPEWCYTRESVSDEKAEQALLAVKSACFGCAEHSNDCSLAKAVRDITEMLEVKE